MEFGAEEYRAVARFQRVSPQKARLVLGLIQGRRAGEALETVAFTKKGVAPLVEKVLRSAIQNAQFLSDERNLDIDVDNLYVKRAVANDGPRMKRIRPAPMGRAYHYQRRISHIEIAVAERKRVGLVEGVEPGAETEKKAKRKSHVFRSTPRSTTYRSSKSSKPKASKKNSGKGEKK